ncbi:MAG: glycosyltransferase family 2 protein, partial [Proteobacteria bacterium]|nr:glycosyltransferase family 2 protein [Pseudomonadota bacterium]
LCLITNSSLAPNLDNIIIRLQASGWRVTVLDCAEQPTRVAPQTSHLDITNVRLRDLYHATAWYAPVQAVAAYHWLGSQHFDLVIAYQDGGGAFFTAMARQLCLFDSPVFALLDRPHAMHLEQACRFPADYSDFEIHYLEQQTAVLADGVVLSDIELREWLSAVHWPIKEPFGLIDNSAAAASTLTDWATALSPRRITTDQVSITVCIATYNRAHYLRQALHSLEAQTLRDFQVIVMDDGSTDPAIEALHKELAPLFAVRGWLWRRQANAGPAPARNAAARLATSSHILFMDDDNLACPNELERLAKAARSGTPIINCLMGLHPDSVMSFAPVLELPDIANGTTRPLGWIPLGSALDLAPFVNRMGDTNSLFRRDIFWQLGGFQGSRDMVFEDFTLLQRAVIAGHQVMTIPEILMLYRRTADSRSMGPTIFTSHLESLIPMAEQVPSALHPWLLDLRRHWYMRHAARRIDSTKAVS